MLVYKRGDLLDATEDIICHQCNTEGIFGGGLALQIKTIYPECEEVVRDYVESIVAGNVIGTYYMYETDRYQIANCFSQNTDFSTNYEALKLIFGQLLDYCVENNYSIAIPYMYGCGIADGDWLEVRDLFMNLSDAHGLDITVYQREEDL